jgi:transcriptional regulator with XRE-family HTH domain
MSHDRRRVVSADSLAGKLGRLFDLHRRPDGRKYSLREVAKGVSEGGVPLSASYLSQLITGQRDNPSGAVLKGLARFFRVDVGYFLGEPGDVERIDAHLALRQVMRDREIRDLAVRASQLTPASLRALTAFIEHLETSPAAARRRRGTSRPDGGDGTEAER